MTTITLFEHQTRSYTDLGWGHDDPVLESLDQLNQSSKIEIVHLGRKQIQATHNVGVIRVGDTALQILPKIDYDPVGDAEALDGSVPKQMAERSATRNLLHMLSYTRDIEIREQAISPLLTQRSDWFELLTRIFATNLHRLMQHGLERSYIRVEEILPVMRGRWQIGHQIKRHPHIRLRFDVAYDEFSPDTPLNQVFLFVTERLAVRTQDAHNRRLLLDIREWLADVQKIGEVSLAQLARITFTRLNERYRPAFNLARLFIENSAFQLAIGRGQNFAFVFDMDLLFEEFVARFLTRYKQQILPDDWRGVEVKPQSQGQLIYLAERLPMGKPAFRLIPDVLITRPSGKPLLILDTKYKQLDNQHAQLGVSREDVYQMLAYAVRLDCPRVLLLYPQSGRIPKKMIGFEIRGYPSRLTVATINLHQPLDQPDALIQELREIVRTLSAPMLTEVM